MLDQPATPSRLRAWLVALSGALAGTRYSLTDHTTRIGRGSGNEIVLDGPDCTTVSQSHLEITREGDRFRVRDLDSTNGTWIDDERIAEVELVAGKTIRLGALGPEFTFLIEEGPAAQLDRTVEIPMAAVTGVTPDSRAPSGEHDRLLTEAVTRARRLRSELGHGQTMTIMRHVVDRALNQTRRRWRRIVLALIGALIAISAGGVWRIVVLVQQKRAIDARIREIEAQLEKPEANQEQTDRLRVELNQYATQAESLEQNALYRLGARDSSDYLNRELRAVMAEFGAEVYSIPPDFAQRVSHYIELDLGPNRPLIARA